MDVEEQEGSNSMPASGPPQAIRLNSVFSLNKIHSVFSTFCSEKRELVQSIGFGCLLSVRGHTHVSRQLAFWLLRNMDYSSSCLVLRNGIRLKISDLDVQLVLGLPHESNTAAHRIKKDVRATEIVKGILKLGNNMEITMEYLEEILTKDYNGRMSTKEKHAFKVSVVLFADAYMLAPKGPQAKVNYSIFPDLIDPNGIAKVDWSGYVLKGVKQASRRVQQAVSNGNKSVTLDCCLIFLEIFYLDNLDIGVSNPDYSVLPRIKFFSQERLKAMVQKDRDAAVDEAVEMFGRLELRANQDVIYSRNSRSCDVKHTPYVNTSKGCSYVLCKLESLKKEIIEHNEEYKRKVDESIVKFESLLVDCVYVPMQYDNVTPSKDVENSDGPSSVKEMLGSNPSSCCVNRAVTPSVQEGSHVHITVDSSSGTDSMMDEDEQLTSLSPVSYSPGPAFDCSAQKVDDAFAPLYTIRINGSKPCDFLVDKVFPCSPFDLILEDPVAPKLPVLSLLKTIPHIDDEDKQRFWFIHDIPFPISLSGATFQSIVNGSSDLCSPIVDALCRLNNYLDDTMYLNVDEKRWRHFLPASWAEVVLHEPSMSWGDRVHEMFAGSNISYDVADCRLVFAPVLVEWNWCCYSWDFKRCVVVVIDPTNMHQGESSMDLMHDAMVKKLTEAMLTCIDSFCPGHSIIHTQWTTEYLIVEDAGCFSCSSGLYAVVYSRFFDGNTLIKKLNKDLVPSAMAKLMYQLLMMHGNMGHLPTIMESGVDDVC